VGIWLLVALDLQNCGVSNTGGKAAMEMLHFNTSLEIVDLRDNQNISSDLLTQIMRQLRVNNKGVPLKVMAE
jgi:cell division FtsZ-interacting protein ZapD